MKFMIVKCSTMCAKMKSANPRSGLISLNCALFCGFACNLKHTEKNKTKINSQVHKKEKYYLPIYGQPMLCVYYLKLGTLYYYYYQPVNDLSYYIYIYIIFKWYINHLTTV